MNASILIVDDEIKMGKALRHGLVKQGYSVDITQDPRKGVTLFEENSYDVLLCDLKMPGMSGLDVLERAGELCPEMRVIIMTAYASAETAVEAMKLGAYDYIIKPFAMDEMKILIERSLKSRALERENERLKDQLLEKFQPENVVVASKIMQRLLDQARKVATAKVTVLITGESGTGKEMLASVIHTASPRRRNAFVAVNCGALTETLLESELFGHRRGAFTGAFEDRAGLFEAADKGTLFLDEIGEISPAMQVKLLRVLQNGEFQRVGDSRVIRVDTRLLAATNRDLEKMVESGEFRTDLYYRLNVVPLYVPPLRQRDEDIPALIEHFLRVDESRGGRSGRGFTPRALSVMSAYGWPGNVRELENAIEHALVMAENNRMDIESLPLPLRAFAGEAPGEQSLEGDAPNVFKMENMTLEEAERRLIQAAMKRTGNNMTRAARELGVTRRTMGYRLRKYNFPGKNDPEEEE